MNRIPVSRIMYDTRLFFLNLAVLLARCSVGILLVYAGGGKVFKWFGYGVAEAVAGFAEQGFPAPFAYLSIYTEFIGGGLLILGLFTRPAAFAIIINMAVATVITMPNGLLGPGGGHIPLLYLVIAIIILLTGPMTYSLDWLLFRNGSRHWALRVRR